MQALTGSILAMYYKPDPKNAYSSIQHITNDIFAGWLVRGMHRWGASVFIILMFMIWVGCSCSAPTSIRAS